MTKFSLTGEFYAEDLDDAFRLLAAHFEHLWQADDEDLTVFVGPHKFEIKPVSEEVKLEKGE